MGQGLHTKVARSWPTAGVPHRVLVTASDTARVPNASATAASSGTDLNGRAAQYATATCATTWPFVAGWTAAAPGPSGLRRPGDPPKTVRSFDEVVQAA